MDENVKVNRFYMFRFENSHHYPIWVYSITEGKDGIEYAHYRQLLSSITSDEFRISDQKHKCKLDELISLEELYKSHFLCQKINVW